MPREFYKSHNALALLDIPKPTEHSPKFKDILEYMKRSRIHHAITASPRISQCYIIEFWNTAARVYKNKDKVAVVRATVAGREIEVTAALIRHVLQLDDQPGDPVEYSDAFTCACLRDRMGMRRVPVQNKHWKKDLVGQWKHMYNVLLASFSARKDGVGSDVMSIKMMTMLACLGLNKPYNISQYVFDNLWDQIQAREAEQYYLYPRFLQIIFNHIFPNLPEVDPFHVVTQIAKWTFSYDIKTYRGVHDPVIAPLFGHAIDPNYEPPRHPRYYCVDSEPEDFAYDVDLQQLIDAQDAEDLVNQLEQQGEEDDENENDDEEEDETDDEEGDDNDDDDAEVEGIATEGVVASSSEEDDKESGSEGIDKAEKANSDEDYDYSGPVRDAPPPGVQKKRKRVDSDSEYEAGNSDKDNEVTPEPERRRKAYTEALRQQQATQSLAQTTATILGKRPPTIRPHATTPRSSIKKMIARRKPSKPKTSISVRDVLSSHIPVVTAYSTESPIHHPSPQTQTIEPTFTSPQHPPFPPSPQHKSPPPILHYTKKPKFTPPPTSQVPTPPPKKPKHTPSPESPPQPSPEPTPEPSPQHSPTHAQSPPQTSPKFSPEPTPQQSPQSSPTHSSPFKDPIVIQYQALAAKLEELREILISEKIISRPSSSEACHTMDLSSDKDLDAGAGPSSA